MTGSRMIGFAVAVLLSAAAGAAADDGLAVAQDPELLRFASRAAAWCPSSSFRIEGDERRQTASGSYRLVEVNRECDIDLLSGPFGLLVDEVSGKVWYGSVARLPAEAAGIDPLRLKGYLNQFLPQAMAANLRQKVRLDWDLGEPNQGAVMSFALEVDTGYGEYPKNAAVTADGRYIAMGSPIPLDEDPVAYRRQLLDSSDLVLWDYEVKAPKVEIVEFSDLECPACRVKWDLIKLALETFDGNVRHGMVGFPLPSIHPWAFRAASAAWCVAAQDPLKLLPFKKSFYELQRDMEVSLVTPTSVNFVLGEGLDEEQFRACYLRDSSIGAVHGQMSLGADLGINATPTYVVNGWMVQLPQEEWFLPMVRRLVEGKDLD